MERSVARGGGICMAAACAVLVLMGGITCDVYGSGAADAAGFRADSDCRIRLQLHLRHDHDDQYTGGGRDGPVPDAEPRPPTYNTFVQEPLARPAADGSEAADVVVGHATGVYLSSHARRPPRVGLLYLTAFIDDRGSHGCAAAGSVILMGALSPRACSSSSSSSSSSVRPATALDKPPASAQEDHAAAEEGCGALAVVGGTGHFALASGEARVHFAYRHPSITLHLHLPTSSIRMPSSTAAPPHGRVSA